VDSTARRGGKKLKANKTITVYPRTQLFSDIQDAIIEGRILDITKKGEHLLAGRRGSNPQVAIQKDVLKKNIADFWANVKWLSEKNKKNSFAEPETMTPIKAALQKAGYIDQDGHLQYMQDSENNSTNKGKLSLSSTDDIPIKQGSYNVYGEDVKLEPQGDDFAPIREDAIKQNTVVRDTVEDSLTSETKDADSFTQDTVSSFGIQKMGDYIHVQRQVFDTLLNEGFFTDIATRSRMVTNESTGMDIEINKKGIFETFNLNNYGRLGKFKKIAKLSTIRQIPDALKYGTVIADDIENIYNDGNNKTFAYIEYPTKVNGKDVVLKLAIKKSSQKNKFWVHSLYDVKSVSGSSASTNDSTEAGHITADTDKIVPQKSKGVKREFTEPEFLPPTKETQKAEEAVPKAEATEEVQSSAGEGSEHNWEQKKMRPWTVYNLSLPTHHTVSHQTHK